MGKRTDGACLRSQSRLMGMLANANRLKICILLSQAEWDVNGLALKVGLSQSALSQHLARLLRSGLVSCRRKAQFRYYRCNHAGVIAMLSTLEEIFRTEPFCDAHPVVQSPKPREADGCGPLAATNPI